MLISNGFSIDVADKCIYRKIENNSCIIICLYVDDMVIFVMETKTFLRSKFHMKDLGEA